MREELQKSMTIKGKCAGIKEECNGIVGFQEGKYASYPMPIYVFRY